MNQRPPRLRFSPFGLSVQDIAPMERASSPRCSASPSPIAGRRSGSWDGRARLMFVTLSFGRLEPSLAPSLTELLLTQPVRHRV
jgi:hypothetical protein